MIFLLFQTYFIYSNLQIAGSSEVQNSMDIPEMSVRHQSPRKRRVEATDGLNLGSYRHVLDGGASQESVVKIELTSRT